ncbi:hypothetical protein LTR37_014552 [Vermiconidia calcicola]|uniref:Uncharacterized protein n=1 Tax=Vermiconidia calcicola TaxID=1690605 RepID=A0ACC3MUY9_9PEZI|nr:hypothetical protein LTR37_014552 [Vermiconidia calcicola]
MDHPCIAPGYLLWPYAITDTKQFDHFLDSFIHGVDALEEQERSIAKSQTFTTTETSAMTQALLNTAKALTGFLVSISLLSPMPRSASSQNAQRAETMWLNTVATELRVQCHRYSLVVMRITGAMQRKLMLSQPKQKVQEVETCTKRPEDCNEPKELSPGFGISPTESTHTGTSAQSWWSRHTPTSPTGSVSSLGSGRDDEIWKLLGCATVRGDALASGWSPLNGS